MDPVGPRLAQRARGRVGGRRAPGGWLSFGMAVVLLVAALVCGTLSAFSATTSDAGNSLATGTVVLSDNDSASPMFTLSALKPGDTDTSCVQVSFTGTLTSHVRLYGTTGGNGLADYVNLQVTRGTWAAGFDDCSGFTADATDWNGQGAGVVYSGTLTAFADDWAGGTVDPKPSAPEDWTTGESHTYRFQLSLQDSDLAQGKSFTQAFTFEARNTSAYSQVVLGDNPLSYWRLNESTGTVAADATGARNAAYVNGPTLGTASGVTGGGTTARFVYGNWSSVDAGDAFDFTGLAPFSAECWLQRTTTDENSSHDVLHKNKYIDWNNQHGWDLGVTAANDADPSKRAKAWAMRYNGASVAPLYSTTTIDAGPWYHVVTTYDGTTMRLYVNGALEGSVATAMSIADSTEAFKVTEGSFDGAVDEVAIYGYALSGAQVGEHYTAGR
jgi:hypothetical protein